MSVQSEEVFATQIARVARIARITSGHHLVHTSLGTLPRGERLNPGIGRELRAAAEPRHQTDPQTHRT